MFSGHLGAADDVENEDLSASESNVSALHERDFNSRKSTLVDNKTMDLLALP